MAAPVTTGVNVQGGVGEGEFDIASYIPMIVDKFIAVMTAVLVLAVAIFSIRYIRRRLKKIEVEHEQQRNAINLLDKITSGFIIVMGMTISLKIVGIDMTLLVSVAVLGLSYGLQDIIKNYVAGILILFKAPFRIGEIVKIRDYTGKVQKMDFQSTTLETFDNRHVTIYNSDVMTQTIVNYSNNTMRRLDIDVGIGYGSDVSKALEIFNKILKGYEKVLKKPKHSVVFKKFNDMGAVFTLKFWVARPCNILKIKTDVAEMIHKSFDENSIFMPYSKGIEVGNEDALTQISEAHKQRNTKYFALPMFTAPLQPAAVPVQPIPVPVLGPDGQPLIGEDGRPVTEIPATPVPIGADGQPVTGPGGRPLTPEEIAAYTEESSDPDYEEPE